MNADKTNASVNINPDDGASENGNDRKRSRTRTRTHSTSSSSSQQNVSNKTILAAIKSMETHFTAQFDAINDTINKKVSLVEANMNAKIDNITESLASKCELAQVYKSVDSRFNVVESRVERIERMSLVNDVIISGIPVVESSTTSTADIVVKISEIIGAAMPPNSFNAFRLGGVMSKSNVMHTKPVSIYVKFYDTNAKRHFFKCYLAHRNLKLNDIGIAVNERIFVNDSLTKQNNDIHKLARRLKKSGKLYSVYTSSGMVYVRYEELGDSKCIRDMKELLPLAESCSSNAATTSSVNNRKTRTATGPTTVSGATAASTIGN